MLPSSPLALYSPPRHRHSLCALPKVRKPNSCCNARTGLIEQDPRLSRGVWLYAYCTAPYISCLSRLRRGTHTSAGPAPDARFASTTPCLLSSLAVAVSGFFCLHPAQHPLHTCMARYSGSPSRLARQACSLQAREPPTAWLHLQRWGRGHNVTFGMLSRCQVQQARRYCLNAHGAAFCSPPATVLLCLQSCRATWLPVQRTYLRGPTPVT